MIHCNPTQLLQVFVNLLKNATDAVELLEDRWIHISIHGLEDSNQVEISIADSGKRVSSDIQKKMMQPFFTTKPLGKGTGLGLSISKKIIESHQGAFFLDTISTQTRFVIQLPLEVKPSILHQSCTS